MGCRRAIYNNIAPRPRFFSSEVKKCPRAGPCTRAEGPRARPCPRVFFLPRTIKNRGGGGYIVVYSPTKIIYIINIPLFMFQFHKELFNTIVRSLWNTQQILN